jgi:hypothetical protein
VGGESERRREWDAMGVVVISECAEGYELKGGINEIEGKKIEWRGWHRSNDGTHGREQPGQREHERTRDINWLPFVLNERKRGNAEPYERLYERNPRQQGRLPKLRRVNSLGHILAGPDLSFIAERGLGLCGGHCFESFCLLKVEKGDELALDGAHEIV